ncbi:MAG: response regulator [Sulfurimonas sp.]|uniref:response regulator n=1 Tax=Sulfurimonas sp. TaxID=2022749 RepID=UPI00261D4C50|nr:response regulator [Sulfurimonas sp.]MDD2652890.1 response regulator [Sulfurimonas sp.]MDD3452336.1 response regulator [Sulfurimonas sp.]
MRFLLVEDEAFNIMVLEEMIKILRPDAKVTIANNGQEAYEILKNDFFNLILSDINMPVMDGYELIKKIREELKMQTPVIAVTAFAVQGDREKILMAGFSRYISKPIDMTELEKVLATSL